MQHYVRLTTVAAVMGVTVGWLRGLVYQKVMDDERELQGRGSPYVMHVQQCFQALIAKRMRDRSIGYDLIRDAVWDLEIDRLAKHEVKVANGIKLVLDKRALTKDAREVMSKAHGIEYGYQEPSVGYAVAA
jgi:hypothetical protein